MIIKNIGSHDQLQLGEPNPNIEQATTDFREYPRIIRAIMAFEEYARHLDRQLIKLFYGPFSEKMLKSYDNAMNGMDQIMNGTIKSFGEKNEKRLFERIRKIMTKQGFTRPQSIVRLKAHGCIDHNGKYIYRDLNNALSIDEWVDAHDGHYDAIVVDACNISYDYSEGKPKISEGIRLKPRKK